MSITWRALSVFYLIASSFIFQYFSVIGSIWLTIVEKTYSRKILLFCQSVQRQIILPQTLKIKTKLVMKNHAILHPCFISPILINRNISLLRNINDLCYIQYIMKKTKHFDCFLFGGWFGLWCLTPVSTIIR